MPTDQQQTSRPRSGRSRSRLLALAGAMAAALSFSFADALAQGWWPWSQQESQSATPREPMRPGGQVVRAGLVDPLVPAAGRTRPGAVPEPGQQPGYGQRSSSNICLQLEQRLVAETQGGAQSRDQLPRIESDMRNLDRNYQQAQIGFSRADCYDRSCSPRRCATRRAACRCTTTWRTSGGSSPTSTPSAARSWARATAPSRTTSSASWPATAAASSIRRRRAGATPPRTRSRCCGARNPPRRRAAGGNQFGNLPFATYRTLCVRLCDGYYFPVSFSTLPNHFQRDSELCQSQCAAPADLYYHQNPGGAVEQMVSVNTQQPYTSLKSAWRYRKEYVQGCSCKEAEYNAQLAGDRKAEAPATPTAKGSTARLDPR